MAKKKDERTRLVISCLESEKDHILEQFAQPGISDSVAIKMFLIEEANRRKEAKKRRK